MFTNSKKKPIKLSRKIFFITMLLLLGLMSITISFQIAFFQTFYESKKIENLISSVNRFKELYAYKYTSARAMQDFEIETNSKLALYYPSTGEYRRLDSAPLNDDEDDFLSNSYFKNIINNIASDKNLIKSVISSGNTISKVFNNSHTTSKGYAIIAPMSTNSTNDTIVIAVASVQPVKEATSVIKEFYVYIFVGFFLVALLLSSMYSDLISKPLVKLNKVAKKMAKMDFSEKCEMNRNDEVGNLAETLNFLSENLDGALKDLKRKNQQLEKDIEKERNLELMRKEFTADVSHELKTPIGIIEGYAEGLRDGIVKGEEARVYLDTIIDESKKMSVLVSNMLELSRLESGALKPKFEVFNVNRLIKNLVRKHTLDAQERELTLEFIENTEYSYIHADTFQMEQILTNLITNALKYTPPKEKIIIEIHEEDDKYRLSVVNTGTHIDDSQIDKLFDKFYKVDKSRQRKNNSTGLGLSIVKNLLQLHGFEYSFKNIEDGVEFAIYMPIVSL